MDAVTLALMQYSASSGGGTTKETVTGNAPITLSDASAKPIVSLTQYGLCTQASTPTPSAPVDIKCNNGALRMVDDELPSEYRRVLDITFDGTAYYRTGEELYGSDVVTMTLSNTSSSGQNVFGAYSGTGTGNKNFSFYVYGGGSSSNSYLRYNESLYRPNFGSGKRTVTFGAGGTDGFATDVSFAEETFESSATAYIGHLPNSTSSKYSGTIIGAITVGSRLKYVPCERVSDNVVGYYEVNSGVFIEPYAGSPTFSGYDTSHLTVLSVVGTPEVLTIGNQTASVQNLFGVGNYADTQELIGGIKTSKVGVKVLNGTENWQDHGTYSDIKMLYDAGSRSGGAQAITSTHYVGTSASNASMPVDSIKLSRPNASDENGTVYIKTDSLTLADFKTFLAAQYAAGTPVIVIYPLAEATVESVAGQARHTVAGTNTVSATAEVSPIALEAVYKSGSSSGSSGIWLLQCLLRTSQRKGRP